VNETEWLACGDPGPMLGFLWGKASERKRRLFECACCRRVWRELVDESSRKAVTVAERFADGLATADELESASLEADAAWEVDEEQFRQDGRLPIGAAAYNAALDMGWWGGAPAFQPPSEIIQEAATDPLTERVAQSVLVRDIFGNPFRPVAADPRWLTSTVRGLANAIYAERTFDRLPILADALEDAGCDQPDVLAHCRGDGPHVRGCWVVDLVLGKS
jgi:hypothetical protein